MRRAHPIAATLLGLLLTVTLAAPQPNAAAQPSATTQPSAAAQEVAAPPPSAAAQPNAAAQDTAAESPAEATPAATAPTDATPAAATPAEATSDAAHDAAAGSLPLGSDGQPLNLDFERGTLDGWIASGDAFAGQPVRGDTVAARRGDQQSQHQGEYWIGTFEVAGDAPRGTLTSAPFEVTARWASFLVGGGRARSCRVELVRHDTHQVIYEVSGEDRENMHRVIVDLKNYLGRAIYIRLVDDASGGWGHINFDDFRLYAARPDFPDAHTPEPQDTFAHAGLPPEEAAAAMTLPEGFRATLFAGEPDVVQPIAFALDDRGRLWVAEAYSYPQRLPDEEARDRILIFEDVNGDGRFDKRTVFIEKLNLVSGLEVGFGGVWVGAAPHLLFIPDRNGDDLPDGPPEVLLDGWGYHDTHETLNTFIWGPDGWLYGCHGVFTHSLVGKPDTPRGERQPLNAGIWRYHPTRHEFEVFAHGTSNPWGVDYNDRGQWFCTACVIPHLFHVIPGARYHRQAGAHFNRHTYDDIKTIADHRHWIGATPHAGNARSDAAGGGHAHAGAMIYLGGAWPAEYRDLIFMNNIHGARINVDRLTPQGSGYVGSHGPDFLLANDAWSQILNLRYGPDGQVYLIDWYDENQCHRGDPRVHDRTNGRIFKVSYGQSEPVSVDLRQAGDLELVALQLDENDWYVRHARRILQERAAEAKLAPGIRAELEKLLTTHDDETRRLRALWALHVTGGLTMPRLERALSDASPYVRGWAVQLAAESRQVPEPIRERFTQMARSDPSPIVRLNLASALGRMPLDERWETLAALTSHAEDAADHNLPLMYWYAAEPLVEPEQNRALDLAASSRVPLLLSYTVRRIASEGTPEAIALLVGSLSRLTDVQQQLTLLEGVNQALKGRRRVEMPPDWPAVAKVLRASNHPQVRAQAQALAVTFGDPEALARMRDVLVDQQADLAARRGALESLLGVKDEQLAPALRRLLDDPDLRGAALKGLAAYDDPLTPPAVLAVYPRLPLAERRDALAALASRAGYARELLAAMRRGEVATADVSADLIRQLRNLKDEALDREIAEVWGTVRDTSEDKAALIAQYQKMLTERTENPPDLALGRAVYAKTCQQCHALFGTGGDVGPELTGSNRANLEYLLSNVLDPSALIAKDYMASVIATTDGRVLTGIVRQETPAAVTIQTANETLIIPRDEIDEMAASTKSMMPDDIWQPLSDDEIRALVAYLASPAQTPMLATAENVGGFFNGRDLSGWIGDPALWSVEDGQIVGRSPGLDHNAFLKSEIEAGDFRLSLKVKLIRNEGNSGIQFRSASIEDGLVRGYQADIGPGWWGKLYEEHARGLLWDRDYQSLVRPGEWNDYQIVAVGSKIRTYLNGQLCVDLDDPAGARRGIFALQLHSGPPMEVRFKEIRLEIGPAAQLAGRPPVPEE